MIIVGGMNSAITLEDSFMASCKSHMLLPENLAIATPWYLPLSRSMYPHENIYMDFWSSFTYDCEDEWVMMVHPQQMELRDIRKWAWEIA